MELDLSRLRGTDRVNGPLRRFSRPRRDKCMECESPPKVAAHWANGHGMAWFCMQDFEKWAGEDDRDIVGVWLLEDGQMPSPSNEIKKNPKGTIKVRKLGEDISFEEIMKRLKAKSYPAPHCGREGERGGSAPRDACAVGDSKVAEIGKALQKYAKHVIGLDVLDQVREGRGWLAPDGTFTTNVFASHDTSAQQALDEAGIVRNTGVDPQFTLIEMGFSRLIFSWGLVAFGGQNLTYAQARFMAFLLDKDIGRKIYVDRFDSNGRYIGGDREGTGRAELEKLVDQGYSLVGKSWTPRHIGPLRRLSYPAPHYGRPGKVGGSRPRELGELESELGVQRIPAPENGKPVTMILWRGETVKTPVDEGMYGKGTYFTPHRHYAEGYAQGGKLIKAKVKLKNPFVGEYNQVEELGRSAKKAILSQGGSINEANEASSKAIRQTLSSEGYGGIVIITNKYSIRPNTVAEVIVFDTENYNIIEVEEKSYPAPHCGRPGEVGGSLPREECAPSTNGNGKGIDWEQQKVIFAFEGCTDRVSVYCDEMEAVKEAMTTFQEVSGVKIEGVTIADNFREIANILYPEKVAMYGVDAVTRALQEKGNDALMGYVRNKDTGEAAFFINPDMLRRFKDDINLQSKRDNFDFGVLHEFGHYLQHRSGVESFKTVAFLQILNESSLGELYRANGYPLNKIDDEFRSDFFAGWIQAGGDSRAIKFTDPRLKGYEPNEIEFSLFERELNRMLSNAKELGLVTKAYEGDVVHGVFELFDGVTEIIPMDKSEVPDDIETLEDYLEKSLESVETKGVLRRLSYPAPHCGRPGEKGGSAPREECSSIEKEVSQSSSKKEMRSQKVQDRIVEILADKYGKTELKDAHNAAWLSSDGELLGDLADHQESAIKVMNELGLDYQDRVDVAVYLMKRAGFIRLGISSNLVGLDIVEPLTNRQKQTIRNIEAMYPESETIWAFEAESGDGEYWHSTDQREGFARLGITRRSYPAPHCGRKGEQGGSAPRGECATTSKGDEYERQLLDKYGEANSTDGIWIGPSGKYLAPMEDHQATAMELLGWEYEGSDPYILTKEDREKTYIATDEVVKGGLIRYNTQLGGVYFDIPGIRETTDEQWLSMTKLLLQEAKEGNYFPDLYVQIGSSLQEGKFFTSREAYKLFGLEEAWEAGKFEFKSYPAPHCGRPGEQGGSAPRGECATDDLPNVVKEQIKWTNPTPGNEDTLPPDRMKVLRDWERNQDTWGKDENGLIIAANGETWEPSGRDEISVDWTNEDLAQMSDYELNVIVSHTHPSDTSFSMTDVIEGIYGNVDETRVITRKEVYRVKLLKRLQIDDPKWDAERDRINEFVNWVSTARFELEEKIGPTRDKLRASGMSRSETGDRLFREPINQMWTEAAEKFPDIILYYGTEER